MILNLWLFVPYAHVVCASSSYLCAIIKEVNNINSCCHEHKAYESFGVYRGDC